MNKEEILSKFEPNREYPSYYHESHIEQAMDEYAKQEAIAFEKWKSGLPPSDLCTVWPPAGSGSGTGLYDKSDDDIYAAFLKHQKQAK